LLSTTTATSVKLVSPSSSPVPYCVAVYWRMVGSTTAPRKWCIRAITG